MPGFNIPNTIKPLGTTSAVSSDVKPMTTYSWYIKEFFSSSGYYTSLAIRDVTLPSFSTKSEEVPGASLVYKYASVISWNDVRFTFYDVVTNNKQTVSKLLEAWRDLVWSEKNGLGQAETKDSGYKKSTKIVCSTVDDATTDVWNLHGSWPQAIRYGDLTYTESDIKTVEVVLSYDYASRTDS